MIGPGGAWIRALPRDRPPAIVGRRRRPWRCPVRVLVASFLLAALLIVVVVSIAAAGASDPLGHRWI